MYRVHKSLIYPKIEHCKVFLRSGFHSPLRSKFSSSGWTDLQFNKVHFKYENVANVKFNPEEISSARARDRETVCQRQSIFIKSFNGRKKSSEPEKGERGEEEEEEKYSSYAVT